jgi:hypothetical protein
VSQGKLEVFLEIVTAAVAEVEPPIDITKPPPEDYECRMGECPSLILVIFADI